MNKEQELREVLKGLMDRHWGHPDMGACICEWHVRAENLLRETTRNITVEGDKND